LRLRPPRAGPNIHVIAADFVEREASKIAIKNRKNASDAKKIAASKTGSAMPPSGA